MERFDAEVCVFVDDYMSLSIKLIESAYNKQRVVVCCSKFLSRHFLDANLLFILQRGVHVDRNAIKHQGKR